MSLEAWWPLNGSLEDHSGNSYPLQNSGVTVNNEGKIGKCYSFDGTTHFSILDNKTTSETFSISFWVCQTGSANACLYSTRTVMGYGIAIFILSGSLRFDAGGQWTTSYSVPLNKWIHVTLVKNNTKKMLYINGTFHSETSCGPLTNLYTTSYIGSSFVNDGSKNNGFVGKLNDYRIYSHALSVKEIKEISKAKILHYKFDDPYEEPTTNMKNVVTFNTEEKGVDYFVKKDTDTWTKGAAISNTNVIAGRVYTWSMDVKSDVSFAVKFDANCSSSNYTGNDASMESTQSIISTYDTPGEWKRIGLTVKVKSDAVSPYIHHSFCPAVNSGSPALKVYVKNPQLEEKDHYTPYTPNSRPGFISDCSGLRNNGTCSSNYPTKSNDTPIGVYSMNFTGTEIISTTTSVLPVGTSQEWTVSSWIKFSQIPTGYQYLTNMNLGVRLHHSNTRALNYINSGTNDWYAYSNTYSNTSDWFLFTTSFNQSANRIKIWVNGVNFTGTTISGGGSKVPNGIKSILSMFEGFKGKATDVRIYASELSDQDVLELYQTRASVSKNGMMFVSGLNERPPIVSPGVTKKGILNSNSIVELNIAGMKTKEELGTKWVRVFYHDNKAGTVLFGSNKSEVLKCRGVDKLSDLWALEMLRDKNGKFEFLLQYQNSSGYNRWKQSSNPTRETISGYEAVQLSWTGNSWGGLAPSSGSSTWIDGSPNADTWYYAIGSRVVYQGGIPSATGTETGWVELWVRCEDPEVFKIFKNGTVRATEYIEN